MAYRPNTHWRSIKINNRARVKLLAFSYKYFYFVLRLLLVEREPITFNGFTLEPIDGLIYKTDYWQVKRDIASRKYREIDAIRAMCQRDSFFFLYFVMGIRKANHPFVVTSCRQLDGTRDKNTLDLWAREHFKTTAITMVLSIQDILTDPEKCVGVFSHTKPAANSIVRQMKYVLETSEYLKWAFPDILYENPEKEAFRWSEDAGFFVKRRSLGRKEASLEGFGLIEGMPTGRHLDVRVYDDIETFDIAKSPDTLERLCQAFEMSHYLGTDTGIHRVIGTTYTHVGVLMKCRAKANADGTSYYHTRLKPATEDGTANGKSVFLPEERLVELRTDKQAFFSQMLLDPTPLTDQKLDFNAIKRVGFGELPEKLYKFMLIDPAGFQKSRQSDSWAILVIGVDPYIDDLGASNIFILDGVVDPMNQDEAMRTIIDVYARNGRIQTIGVEKVALSSTEIHVANALRARGKYLTVENGGISLLRPGGRKKQERIESNLMWLINNGKVFIASTCPNNVVERLKVEMNQYPFWHDDALDALSYGVDLIKDYKFTKVPVKKKKELTLWERIGMEESRSKDKWLYC